MKNEEQIYIYILCVCMCARRSAGLLDVRNKLVTHPLHSGFALPEQSLCLSPSHPCYSGESHPNTIDLYLRTASVISHTFLYAFSELISKSV